MEDTIKKLFLGFLFAAVMVSAVAAHTALLTVEDNGDGTIFVQGGFSNGASAAGSALYLTSKATGNRLWEGVFPEIGEINLSIPNEPYTVTFDAGPGHIVTKDGFSPPGGFGAKKSEETDASAAKTSDEPNMPVKTSDAVSWNPQDTVAAMPSAGVSYIALFTLILTCINSMLLIIVLLKKR